MPGVLDQDSRVAGEFGETVLPHADVIAPHRRVVRAVLDLDSCLAADDDISFDLVAVSPSDADAELLILATAKERETGRVAADVVALDAVSCGRPAYGNVAIAVAGDHVARLAPHRFRLHRKNAADLIIVGVDYQHADPVRKRLRAVGLGADVVALDPI